MLVSGMFDSTSQLIASNMWKINGFLCRAYIPQPCYTYLLVWLLRLDFLCRQCWYPQIDTALLLSFQSEPFISPVFPIWARTPVPHATWKWWQWPASMMLNGGFVDVRHWVEDVCSYSWVAENFIFYHDGYQILSNLLICVFWDSCVVSPLFSQYGTLHWFDFQICNQFCVPEINSTWSQCVVVCSTLR